MAKCTTATTTTNSTASWPAGLWSAGVCSADLWSESIPRTSSGTKLEQCSYASSTGARLPEPRTSARAAACCTAAIWSTTIWPTATSCAA